MVQYFKNTKPHSRDTPMRNDTKQLVFTRTQNIQNLKSKTPIAIIAKDIGFKRVKRITYVISHLRRAGLWRVGYFSWAYCCYFQ
jgi:hypothetical protein